MTDLTPQQINLFEKWVQEQADYLAIQIDNIRQQMRTDNNPELYKEILCISTGINSLMTTKVILESKKLPSKVHR